MNGAYSSLTQITWRLDAYAGHWLPQADFDTVIDWMRANRLRRHTAERPVVVEHGQITYGQDRSDATVLPPRDIVEVTTTLLTTPPTVWQPTCTAEALSTVTAVFDEHVWSIGDGNGACVTCSDTHRGADGRLYSRSDRVAAWPCPPVLCVLVDHGFPIPNEPAPRVLGDCLDAAANARAFAHLGRSA
jgi:hypothetical protein